ncbi:hypothetical protein [Lewinella sp. IMCC34191]|uniref:hypothetical protein n=1 Tax=Lewinella sp. IMCC34191 TaxID=2259172 RepID=UPI000E24D6BC|nr:hypothetical protein [Lewinella sp. IMCC34191]
MPDNNTPWSPDEDFWNDAWADMEKRLHRKRRRPVIFPWLLGLALLLGGGALVWSSFGQRVTRQSSVTEQEVAATAPTIPPEETAYTTAERPSQTADTPSGTRTTDIARQDQPAGSPRMPATARTGNQEREGLTGVEEGVYPAPPPPTDESAPQAVAAASPTVPMAAFVITGPGIELPDLRPLATEEKEITPVTAPGRYAMAAGATGYVNSFKPGGFVQFGRRFGGGRWFVPVALRYDYSRRSVSVGTNEDVADAVSFAPYPLNASYYNSFSGALNSRLSEGNAGVVEMHALTLRTGLGRRLGSRFTVSAGAGASYLFAGSGPVVADLSSNNYFAFRVEERRRSFGAANADYAVSPNAGAQAPLTSNINRLLISTWLSADYRLTSHFGITLGFTRSLTPFYRTDALQLESSRIALGVRYGF